MAYYFRLETGDMYILCLVLSILCPGRVDNSIFRASLLQYSLIEQLRTAISQSSSSLNHGMKLAILFPNSAFAYWPLVRGERKEFFLGSRRCTTMLNDVAAAATMETPMYSSTFEPGFPCVR